MERSWRTARETSAGAAAIWRTRTSRSLLAAFIIQTELRILFHEIQREAKVTYGLTLNRLWFCGAKNRVALKTGINIGQKLVLAVFVALSPEENGEGYWQINHRPRSPAAIRGHSPEQSVPSRQTANFAAAWNQVRRKLCHASPAQLREINNLGRSNQSASVRALS